MNNQYNDDELVQQQEKENAVTREANALRKVRGLVDDVRAEKHLSVVKQFFPNGPLPIVRPLWMPNTPQWNAVLRQFEVHEDCFVNDRLDHASRGVILKAMTQAVKAIEESLDCVELPLALPVPSRPPTPVHFARAFDHALKHGRKKQARPRSPSPGAEVNTGGPRRVANPRSVKRANTVREKQARARSPSPRPDPGANGDEPGRVVNPRPVKRANTTRTQVPRMMQTASDDSGYESSGSFDRQLPVDYADFDFEHSSSDEVVDVRARLSMPVDSKVPMV